MLEVTFFASVKDGAERGLTDANHSFLLNPNSRMRSQTLSLHYAQNTFLLKTLKNIVSKMLCKTELRKSPQKTCGESIMGKVSPPSTQGLPLPAPRLQQLSWSTKPWLRRQARSSHPAPQSLHRLWEKAATKQTRSPTI